MKIYKLKDLLTIKNGRDHKTLGDGSYPVYGSGGIMRYADDFLYDKPSILLPRKGSLDNIQYCDVPFWTVDTLYYTEVNETLCDAYYLFRYLRLLDLSQLDSGTGVPSMTFDSYYQIIVKLPTLDIQKQTSSILKSLDSKILLNEQVNQNLEASLQLLFEYTFIQNACSNWSYVPLEEYADIVNGATPSTSNENNYGGDIVWITPKDLSDQSCKFIFHGSRNITKQGYDSCSTTIVPKGTIVMSSRAPIGLLSIAKTSLCTNQGFKSLVPKDMKSSEYLYYYIKYHIPQIQQLGTGTTFKEVSRDDMSRFKILCPDDSTLSKWHNNVSSVFDKQFATVKEIEELTKLRNELLPLLMNGQVSVKQLNSDLSHD